MSHYQLFLSPTTQIPSSSLLSIRTIQKTQTYDLLTSPHLRINDKHHQAAKKLTDYLDATLADPNSWLTQKIHTTQSRHRGSITLSCEDDDSDYGGCYVPSNKTFYSLLRKVTHHGSERRRVAQQVLSEHYSKDATYDIYLSADSDLVISWA